MTRIAKHFVIWSAALVLVTLAASILIPLINRERQLNSNRTPSITHLHQIGLGIFLYTQDHQGHYPETLADLITTENMSSEVLIDPATDDTPAEGKTPEEMKANIIKGGHQTFIYLGAGLTDKIDDDVVVAYEVFPDGGANVLFAGGHGVWLNPNQTRRMLKKQLTSRPTTFSTNFGSED